MSLISYKRGQGSIVLRVKVLNSSVATGAGLTGLTSASTGLIISTIADNEATATAYTVAGSTIEAVTTLGTFLAPTATKCRFKEVDSTNHKGVYEIQIADARFAVSSAKSLLVSLSGATNAAETDAVIPLTDMDPYDAVHAGLTALPNAVAGASGGLHINGSNSGTTTYAALTVTGSLTISDGLLVSRSTTNASGATFTGNGTGSGAVFTSGAGATGDGVQMTAGSTNGSGLKLVKTGSGSDLNATVTPLVLAKTTNITGFNDVAAGAAMTLTAAYDAAKTAMASYTQPTGFLAATFPTTVASPTNITAGTITTTTNLTNAPPDSSGVTTLLSRLSAARAGVIDALSVRTGTAQAGAASTITLDASASATDNLYKDQWIVITSGTGAGQARLIIGYVGSTKVATVERAWATNPDNTSVFYLLTAAGIAHVVLADTTTAVTNSVTAGTVSDKTGYALTAAYDAAKTAMASYTQPTGFLAATFPTTVASTTNITAASGVALTAAYDLAKTAAQAGDAMALVAGAVDSTAIDSTGANEVADALLDRSAAIETGLTPRGALRLIAAEAVGNVTGLDTGSVVIKNAVANSKTRIAATGDAASRTITSTDVT